MGRLRVWAAVFLAALMMALGLAGRVAAADPAADAQAVIAQQIQAFLNDDADKAYGFASPAIRSLFPDKDRFFAMVRKSYQPVYRPGNFAFGRSRVVGDGAAVFQEVLIQGADGVDWSAVYEMLRQPDGAYKINGVQMFKNRTSQGI